jgi:hypothetical protein
MNIQALIIIVLFIAALYYVGRLIYKSVSAKKGCGSNCKCGVDFSQAEPVKHTK